MDLYHNTLYLEDVRYVSNLDLPWNELKNSTIMLSGATGLLGSFLIDVIFEKNKSDNLNCTVVALGRDRKKAWERSNMNCERTKPL